MQKSYVVAINTVCYDRPTPIQVMTPGVHVTIHVTKIALCRKALLSLAVQLLSLSTSGLSQTASGPPTTKADLILINGTILTV
ncbi:MAG TPA: hypothetical protein VK641_02685, partial [Terriglobales bacterium]|nr:hypothetical protein [Terriglobales bacterium]